MPGLVRWCLLRCASPTAGLGRESWKGKQILEANHRIVVTGGAGFLGGHLVERLAADGMGSILVLDNLHRPCVVDPASSPPGVRFAMVDIRNRLAVTEALRGSEVVFHLAAQSNVMGAAFDGEFAFDTNVGGTFNLLQAAKKAGVRRFVFTSSREVYGEAAQLPVSESAPLNAKNAYGASKVAGELYCRLAAAAGLETVVLRLANVYGQRDRDRVIPIFLQAAKNDLPIDIYGGDQIIDFVWVEVVVDALVKAAVGEWVREPVNVGSGKGVTLLELAQRITGVIRPDTLIRIAPKRQEEVRRFVADIARANEVFGIRSPDDPLSHLPLLCEGTPVRA